MRVEEIERLLAEFYEGNTSENQEEKLKKYFESQNIWKKIRDYFFAFIKMYPWKYPQGWKTN